MAKEVRAPIGGTIMDVLVNVGTKVEIDEEVLVIEAMKMQNIVYSPAAGIVTEIRVKPGDKVVDDAVILVVE